MHFNRSDICEAYFLFATLYHEGQGSKTYAILGRLNKIGFTPSIVLDEDKLSDNAKEIFTGLVSKWEKKMSKRSSLLMEHFFQTG